MTLKAPFPWFGGKSRAASLVWERFGDVPNYVEPFAGSLATLLLRPHEAKTETVNDKDAYLVNFWRAVQADPEAVAAWACDPINEADLHARHLWLLAQGDFRERMIADPHHFDAKIAGWWVWGLCSWIGTGWCVIRERGDGRPSLQLPHLGGGAGGLRHRPHRGGGGGAAPRPRRHRGAAGRGVALAAYLGQLAERLHGVRVACGDWTRVLGDSVTHKHGVTAVLLDPPYDDGEMEYSAGGAGIASAVRDWALANGGNRKLRIALCGYEGDHPMPDSWECVAWKARGGYGSQGAGAGRDNAKRERIWFSPACLRPQRSLFDALPDVSA